MFEEVGSDLDGERECLGFGCKGCYGEGFLKFILILWMVIFLGILVVCMGWFGGDGWGWLFVLEVVVWSWIRCNCNWGLVFGNFVEWMFW